MKPRRAARSSWVVRASSIAILAMTASCGMLIGIEDVFPGGGPDGSGGASGDASVDRAGNGGTGGGTGGASGSSGVGTDANVDRLGDISMPGVDAPSDARVDATSDARVSDVIDDRSPSDTAVSDGGADTGDANNAGDGGDSGAPRDVAPPDVASPDASSDSAPPDAGIDAPVMDAGSDRPPTISVTGRIIDYWRHPVPNVPVTIGVTAATTNTNGQFTVTGITPPYDVLFTISTVQNNSPAKYGWIYKGLTRPDPTLQVGRAFPQRSASQLDISITSVDFNNLPATESVHTSFGGVDGAFDTYITGTPTSLLQSSWFGPTSTSMTGHALHWTRASSTDLDAPTGYSGHAVQGVSLVDSTTASVSFDLPNMTMSVGALSGSATGSLSVPGQLEHSMYLRFADNAVVQLLSVTAPSATFSYMTPAIAQSTLTMAASQGIYTSPPYAVVHKDGLPSTQSGITLQVPDTPSLIQPGGGTTGVNPSTLFRWSGTAKVFLWSVGSDADYQGFFVVTSEKQAQIPTMPDGPALSPNAIYTWWVETNGSYQTVDEAAGADGMMDSFRYQVLWGPIRGDGSYTSSEENKFTSAP
jgi:hypothetical protein